MLGISQNAMVGILSAQSSIQLASQNQGIANATYRAGRIRERQGATDGNMDAVEEGKALQAEGKEKEAGTFKHLQDAIDGINNIDTVVEQYDDDAAPAATQENDPEKPRADVDGHLPGGFDVVVSDATPAPASAPKNKVDVTV